MTLTAVCATAAALAISALLGPVARADAAPVQRLIAPVHICPNQNSVSGPRRVFERSMRCLVNQARKRSGLRTLSGSANLHRSARRKSDDIRRCGQFSHTACGRDFAHWIRRGGYASGCWSAAENIAWGSGRRGSARKIFAAWLRSSGHRAAIMSRDYVDFGIGLRRKRQSGGAPILYWTAHFGRRC